MKPSNHPEILYDQLQAFLQLLSKCNLPFFNELKCKWTSLLKININDPVVSTYRHDSNGQVLPKWIHTNRLDFMMHFDITHLRKKYSEEQKAGILNNFLSTSLYVLPNGVLACDGCPCSYSYYPSQARKPYYEDDGIFLAMSPTIPKTFFIVDGNHRISYFIDSGRMSIPALLICPEAVPAYLISSDEMVTYLFMYDLNLINNALKSNTLNSIKQELSIFNKSSVLYYLIEINRIDNGNNLCVDR